MTIYDQRIWRERLARWCVWSAILAAAAWWYATRERPVTAQQRLATVRNPIEREAARRIAADNLQHADASIVPELMRELATGDVLGRELAALALGRLKLKAEPALEALAQAAHDAEAAAVRRQAVIALGRIGTHQEVALAALRDGAHDPDPDVRNGAFTSLRSLGASGAGELARLLADREADVRRRAVIELGQMGLDADEALAEMRGALNDPDAHVRAEAYAALGNLFAIDADDLASALESDPDALVRLTAVRLLDKRADTTAGMLTPALYDQEAGIRSAALGALIKLGLDAEAAVPLIMKLLDSDDWQEVWRAADALGYLGPAARSAIERLLDCTGDRDSHIRSIAYHALRRLGREAQLRPPELFKALHADGDGARSLILWSPDPLPAPEGEAAPALNSQNRPLGYGVTDADMVHLKSLTHLAVLNLAYNPVGDAGLANLADLRELKRLDLSNTKVTSAGLRHLLGLTKLERLSLGRCAITDNGLSQLARLRSLKDLVLYGTQVTDDGLRYLAELHQLKSLELHSTSVTDTGLAHLKGLPFLEELEFPEGVTLAGLAQLSRLTMLDGLPESVTDGDLAALEALTRLRSLSLARSSITDDGLVWVGKCASLENLFLNQTITDAGLAHLRPLSKLRSLWLDRSKLSQHAIDELKQALPGVTIMPDANASRRDIQYEVIGLKPLVAIRP